ncbi:MAG: hypothetical protein BGO54_13970 [Sphingobacteriales bacterium 46-32]|nr:MAG: hypothetical protein BGO54_13970 [Sphingobacteriales bacterium 46-32]
MRNENSKIFTKILIGLSSLFIVIIAFLYLTIVAERPGFENMIKGQTDSLNTSDTLLYPLKDSIK